MPIDKVLMPQFGMNMTEGTITSWLVPEGARVQRGEPLLEVETDKLSFTIESPAEGVVQRVAAERATVPIQDVVAYLLAPGEAPADLPASVPPAPAPTARPAPPASPPRSAGEVRASPIARTLAAEHGLDLAAIAGTGPGGRIVEADVRAAIARARAAPTPSERRIRSRIPLAGRRKVIAERMMASLAHSAQLTITREVDATELVRAREQLLERADALGVRVGYDALLAKVLADALREQPALNAVLEGDAILLLADVHVGVAVASEGGLVVPVVRNAEARPLVEVARAIEDFAARVKEDRLVPDDLAGGTVTLTNLGGYGVDGFTPILNPPQSAILGVGRIAPRPFALGHELGVRPTLHLSLTWDHRVADGAQAALLLGRTAELIGDRGYLAGLG